MYVIATKRISCVRVFADPTSGPSYDIRLLDTFLEENNITQRLSLLCLTATQVIANKATLEWIIFVLFGFVFWLSVHSSKCKLVDTVQWINCFTSQYVIAKYWAGMHAFEWQIPLMEN